MPPPDISFAFSRGIGGIFPLLQFSLIKTCAQHVPCGCFVFMLRAFILTLHNDAGWFVGNPHRTIGGVDVLPPRTGRAIGINPAIAFIDINVDVFINDREHPYT